MQISILLNASTHHVWIRFSNFSILSKVISVKVAFHQPDKTNNATQLADKIRDKIALKIQQFIKGHKN